MSIRAIQQVWDSDVTGNVRWLLLALADYADHEGVCWPSYAALARKLRCSERTVYRLVAEAWGKGYIVKIPGGGAGNSNRYILALNPDSSVRETTLTGTTKTLTGTTPKTLTPTAVEPSVRNRQVEPSLARGRKITVGEALRKAREAIDPDLFES